MGFLKRHGVVQTESQLFFLFKTKRLRAWQPKSQQTFVTPVAGCQSAVVMVMSDTLSQSWTDIQKSPAIGVAYGTDVGELRRLLPAVPVMADFSKLMKTKRIQTNKNLEAILHPLWNRLSVPGLAGGLVLTFTSEIDANQGLRVERSVELALFILTWNFYAFCK